MFGLALSDRRTSITLYWPHTTDLYSSVQPSLLSHSFIMWGFWDMQSSREAMSPRRQAR